MPRLQGRSECHERQREPPALPPSSVPWFRVPATRRPRAAFGPCLSHHRTAAGAASVLQMKLGGSASGLRGRGRATEECLGLSCPSVASRPRVRNRCGHHRRCRAAGCKHYPGPSRVERCRACVQLRVFVPDNRIFGRDHDIELTIAVHVRGRDRITDLTGVRVDLLRLKSRKVRRRWLTASTRATEILVMQTTRITLSTLVKRQTDQRHRMPIPCAHHHAHAMAQQFRPPNRLAVRDIANLPSEALKVHEVHKIEDADRDAAVSVVLTLLLTPPIMHTTGRRAEPAVASTSARGAADAPTRPHISPSGHRRCDRPILQNPWARYS